MMPCTYIREVNTLIDDLNRGAVDVRSWLWQPVCCLKEAKSKGLRSHRGPQAVFSDLG